MMKMNLASRVETQLRFSDPPERKKLLAAFTVLQHTPISELLRDNKLHIHRTRAGREVYIYFSSVELGIVLSIQDQEWLVEDIFNRHSRLNPLNMALAA